MGENSKNLTNLRFAIVGTGSIAGLHYQAIGEIENIEVAAFCSSSQGRAKAAQEKYNVPCYWDLEELFDKENIDAVIICTASGNHLEPCRAAAERGIHVLSEKPLEVTVERAQQMIDICRENNVKLGCIFQSRFNPAVQKLKKAISEGQLGDLLLGNAYIKWYRPEEYYSSSPWRGTLKGDGGASLINQGIHTIDLLQYMMGSVRAVTGRIQTRVHEIEGEDLGVALVEFENNALGTIEGSTAVFPGYPERLEIFGSKGSVILEGGKVAAWNLQGVEKTEEIASEGPGSGASDPMAIDFAFHQYQIEDFATAIREDREPVITGEEGLKALSLIKAIYQSSAEDRKVELS